MIARVGTGAADGVAHGVSYPLSNPPFSMPTVTGHPGGVPDSACMCTGRRAVNSKRSVVAVIDGVGIFASRSSAVDVES